ncbi:MAG: hypothetical protein CML17_12220 [Pusillimonas sp.]|nr:hypothetical protein [Pusillimonas sp.]
MSEIVSNFVNFNGNGPLFHPTVAEAGAYGVDRNKSWVKTNDGTLINPVIWPTNGGYKKAIINSSNNTDIGFFSFRASSTVPGAGLNGPQRSQMHVRSASFGNKKYYSTIGENKNPDKQLRRGSTFRVLAVRISNGVIIDNNNEESPGQRAVPLITLFTNNHPLPQDDGYYVFIFSFGIMYEQQTGMLDEDDSRYNLFYAKVA